MEQQHIGAKSRQRVAKGDNRRLRREGEVPAVVYGGQDINPRMVAINDHELELILRGARHSNRIFNLKMEDGSQEQTIIRAIQRHPVTSRLVHVDFYRVDLEREVEVEVPIRATGATPAGVKEGGVLEHVTRAVTVRCKPLEMPQFLEADLSGLVMNQSFHVSDLKLPEAVRVVDEPGTTLFVVVAPAAAAAETEAEAEGPAEPELIGEKKKAEGEEEAE